MVFCCEGDFRSVAIETVGGAEAMGGCHVCTQLATFNPLDDDDDEELVVDPVTEAAALLRVALSLLESRVLGLCCSANNLAV